MTAPTDIREHIAGLCSALGIEPRYVERIDVGPDVVWVDLFKGRDGRCSGPLYALDEHGEPCHETGMPRVVAARETVVFEVRT